MWIIWPFKKRNFGSAWADCSAFHRFIEPDIGQFIIKDEKRLPHPKPDLFESMCVVLLSETDQSVLEKIKLCAFELAFFQTDVGDAPLHPLGIDWNTVDATALERRADAATINPSGKAAYDRFKLMRDADWERMKAVMADIQRQRTA